MDSFRQHLYDQREFYAGFTAGFLSTMCGQPFDTVKVRVQSTNDYVNGRQCFLNIVKNEGPQALYKGVLSPLLGSCLTLSVFFGVDGFLKKTFSRFEDESGQLPVKWLFVTGGCASLTQGLILIPTEHVRIRMQIQVGSVLNNKYKSTFDCYTTILRENGIRGLMRGTVATLMREGYPGSLYMVQFEMMSRWIAQYQQKVRKDVNSGYFLAIGSITGICYWTICYPYDIIKTKMQSDCLVNPKYKGFIDCWKHTMKGGISSFFKGYFICISRAAPINAISFTSFEKTNQYLEKFNLTKKY